LQWENSSIRNRRKEENTGKVSLDNIKAHHQWLSGTYEYTQVLHSHKIVHRDLKAENIMSHNGTYKIIDFGFSKKLQISQ